LKRSQTLQTVVELKAKQQLRVELRTTTDVRRLFYDVRIGCSKNVLRLFWETFTIRLRPLRHFSESIRASKQAKEFLLHSAEIPRKTLNSAVGRIMSKQRFSIPLSYSAFDCFDYFPARRREDNSMLRFHEHAPFPEKVRKNFRGSRCSRRATRPIR